MRTYNVAALSLTLPPEHRAALDAVSGGNLPFLYGLFAPAVRNQVVFGGGIVRSRNVILEPPSRNEICAWSAPFDKLRV